MNSNQPISPVISQQTHIRWVTWFRRISVFVLIAASIFVGMLQVQAPKPAPNDAPADQFSADRALEKLKVIAKNAHPIGSASHTEVRDYLISELRQLGYQPEIQKATVSSDLATDLSGNIENIVTRIPGTNSSKALMIAAHYDSVPEGPGAADDGAGIAAMLETVRAIQAGQPLKNDLILLMTDGEEMGLLGAKAFIQDHPWVQDVGLVLNFEARGNKGPVFMFETSDQNGWIIQEFMKAAPQPIAYSLIYNVYKLMPNDTDLTMFKQGGLPGMNFAFGMGLDAYHSPTDTPENLDQRSLQHHGEYMLNLSRHFGQLDLSEVRQEDRIYFNVFGWHMVSYPQSWAIGFIALGVLLFVFTLWHGFRQHRLTLRGMVGGILIPIGSLGLVYGVITWLWHFIPSNLSRGQYMDILTKSHISVYYLIGLLVVTALITIGLYRWLSRYVRTENVWASILLLWLLFGVATAFMLPGGSYLMFWPFVFSLIGINISFQCREERWTWLAALFAVPGLVLITPIFYLVYMMMTLNMAGALMTVVALASTLIYPVFSKRLSTRKHS
ncbi:M20/M25/M40 family metallo-hydrolase [Paenibacillus terrigena]|uniref:M20/M25/M40 family metallo-hydrolase n=1 Tax=Paenibacillus terrigena TaxID=369333 RepID=UPI0028D30144|nr:M20/M25/M40 family metallo-hydrolase [Paenibacillus terrigena]